MNNVFSKWNELSDVGFAILPIGSIEQHGPHLPLCTDGIIANALAEKLAAKFEKSYLLPLIPFSNSYEHIGFPGSVSLKVNTLVSVINDIMESLALSGIQKCVLVNGHQGNFFLTNLVQELNRSGPRVFLVPSRSQWDRAYIEANISTSISADMHAGEGETSLVMHLHPELVFHSEIRDVDASYRPLFNVHGIKIYSETGAIGFPSRASVEKGLALLNSLFNSSALLIKEFINE